MSIGTSQQYLDWAALQDNREQDNAREWQEMMYEMTREEREEYESWLDTLDTTRKDSTCHAPMK